MQTLHMPDETCDICGEDFRPCAFGQHWETCDGTLLSRNSAAHHKKLFKFWVEVPEAFESSTLATDTAMQKSCRQSCDDNAGKECMWRELHKKYF